MGSPQVDGRKLQRGESAPAGGRRALGQVMCPREAVSVQRLQDVPEALDVERFVQQIVDAGRFGLAP